MAARKTTSSREKRRRGAARGHAPRLILCAGLKSSGSTWLYNAVIQMMKADARARGGRVMAFYAEDVKDFPPGAERATVLVVKTHIPSAALILLAQFLGGRIFLTVREPRDAIASLMQRFRHEFDGALREVSAGGARMVALAQVRPFLLRYEDGFTERPQTVRAIARHLGLTLPAAMLDAIHASLSRDTVRARIAALARKGVFGKRPDPDRFDPATHWHHGHVGDGAVGKYAAVLSPGQERAVLASLRTYCAAFGYPLRGTGPSRAAQGKARHSARGFLPP
jgi:hypothetical protein